jgi:hypothetical protein
MLNCIYFGGLSLLQVPVVCALSANQPSCARTAASVLLEADVTAVMFSASPEISGHCRLEALIRGTSDCALRNGEGEGQVCSWPEAEVTSC